MADNEVKIHVSADADLKGIDDAARKVEDLAKGRSQTATEANPRPAAPSAPSTSVSAAGWESLEKRRQELLELRRKQQEAERQGDAQGARDIGRRADKMEKGIDREGARLLRVEDEEAKRAAAESAREAKTRATEERAAARERREAEREVTREMKAQHGMRRAGIQTAANVFHGAEQIATGANAPGAAASTLVQMGAAGGLAGLVAGIAAAGGISLKAVLDKESEKNALQQMGYDREARMAQYRQARMMGSHGSSAALVSGSLDAQEEVFERTQRTDELQRRAALKWYDPASWFNAMGLVKSDAQRELEDNENARLRSQTMAESLRKQAESKFLKEEGGQALRTLRGRSQRTLDGSREAFKGELGEQWFSDYHAAKQASGSDAIAKEMADLGYQNTLRDRQAAAGAGLVDARTGGAGIAAAARWATGSTFGADEAVAELRSMHQTVLQSNQAIQLVNQAKP